LPNKIGLCPRDLIAQQSGAKVGTCASQGFTVAAGKVNVTAGPCGSIEFDTFTKPAIFFQDDSVTVYVADATKGCAQASLPSKIGLCPRDLIA